MGDIHLKFEVFEGETIARVTVDRTSKLNVLNSALIKKLKDVFVQLADNQELRLVILDGAGDTAWVGGADIAEMANFNTATAAAFISALHQAMLAIRDLPVPVVARINGYALGAGMELAAACDTRIASTTAKFGMPETRVGIPSVIEASLLPRLMNPGRAARLCFTGEIIDAQRAYEWGFIEELVAPEELDSAVYSVVRDICAAGPNAIRLQKQLLRSWEGMSPDAAAEASVAVFASAFETDEPKERLGDFLNKKKSAKS